MNVKLDGLNFRDDEVPQTGQFKLTTKTLDWSYIQPKSLVTITGKYEKCSLFQIRTTRLHYCSNRNFRHPKPLVLSLFCYQLTLLKPFQLSCTELHVLFFQKLVKMAQNFCVHKKWSRKKHLDFAVTHHWRH